MVVLLMLFECRNTVDLTVLNTDPRDTRRYQNWAIGEMTSALLKKSLWRRINNTTDCRGYALLFWLLCQAQNQAVPPLYN